jgi:hypothetical protein
VQLVLLTLACHQKLAAWQRGPWQNSVNKQSPSPNLSREILLDTPELDNNAAQSCCSITWTACLRKP